MKRVGGLRVSSRTKGSAGRRQARCAVRAVAPLAAVAALAAAPTGAASIDGAVRYTWTETDFATSQTSSDDLGANLSLNQELTPFLRLRFYGVYGEQSTAVDGDEMTSRSVLQPRVELAYGKPGLSWRIGWENRRIDSLEASEELESTALLATLSWQPRDDFRLSLGYRDTTNEADVSALGREIDERRGSVDAVYQRPLWGLGYSASYNELVGGAGDLEIEQLRPELRLQAARQTADGRLRFAVAGSASRVDAEQRRGEGELGEPLPALQGLYAIDASPAIGELVTTPGLVDGDAVNAVSPAIEIGGANTFRNVGVDLGLPLPATRLEVAVDRLSDAQLAWEVYESADGVIWDRVAVVSREFDATLLRYRLRFPQTSGRFLKAVNVGNNEATDVRVTEVRALRELGEITAPERGSELYRAAANFGWRVAPRVSVDAGADYSNDVSTIAGIVRRDQTTSALRAGMRVDLARDLTLSFRFRRSESEERRVDGINRSTDDLGASLRWSPLPTVDALLSAGVRTDSDESRELSNLESVRLTVSLDLLDELQLISDASFSRLDGAAVARARDTLSWSQRVEMRPLRNWRLNAGYSWSRTESTIESGVLFERTGVFVGFDWSPGSALTVRGTLDYSDDARSAALRQSYGLFWSPGPKLSMSLSWDQFEQEDGLLTANESFSVNYKLATRVLLFSTLSRSRSELGDGVRDEFTSAYAGTSLSF